MLKNKAAMMMVVVILLGAIQAQAGMFKDIRYAMNYAGFSQSIKKDILAQGQSYEFAQTFTGEEISFGSSEMTLTGTVNGNVSYSTVGIPEVNFNLQTSGLAYTYDSGAGVNHYTIDDGYAVIDENISINEFGMYSIEYTVTNRATLVCEGAVDKESSLNFDVGPVDVQGHWLIDVFNLTVGKAMGFSLPGGGLDQIALGWSLDDLIADEIATVTGTSTEKSAAGISFSSASLPISSPEPMTMSLMVIGAGMLLRRKF
jgi:hypothetical protein